MPVPGAFAVLDRNQTKSLGRLFESRSHQIVESMVPVVDGDTAEV